MQINNSLQWPAGPDIVFKPKSIEVTGVSEILH